MTNFILVIDIVNGVCLRLPGVLESKHYSSDQIELAGRLIAQNLGGRYSHWGDA